MLVVDPFGLRESDSMSPTTTCIVAALYIVACLLALAGIAVTLSVFFRHNHDGTANIETRLVIGHKLPDHKYPGGWGIRGTRPHRLERHHRPHRKPHLAPVELRTPGS